MSHVVLHSARSTKRRRLCIAGVDLFSPRTSPPRPLDLAPLETWLGSCSRAEDVAEGPLDVTHIAAGLGHSLVGYRTAEGVERVLSIGRNESGQLGVGYNSAERTRGLVEGFEGERIVSMHASAAASYLVVKQHNARNQLYAFGSKMRGQLGLPSPVEEAPAARIAHMTSRATLVDLPPLEDGSPRSNAALAVGFEHALALDDAGHVFATGANPDGQLGLGDRNDRDAFILLDLTSEVRDDGVRSIRAGADTSALITQSGRLFTFGNSEYGQALHGRLIDSQTLPLAVDWPSPVRDVRFGGSFALLLDDRNQVHVAGYGALGLGQARLEAVKSTRLEVLNDSIAIRAAYGYAAAFTHDRLHVWGLGTTGRLGFGKDVERLFEPTQLRLPNSLEGAEIVDAQLGGETLFVVVQEA